MFWKIGKEVLQLSYCLNNNNHDLKKRLQLQNGYILSIQQFVLRKSYISLTHKQITNKLSGTF